MQSLRMIEIPEPERSSDVVGTLEPRDDWSRRKVNIGGNGG